MASLLCVKKSYAGVSGPATSGVDVADLNTVSVTLS